MPRCLVLNVIKSVYGLNVLSCVYEWIGFVLEQKCLIVSYVFVLYFNYRIKYINGFVHKICLIMSS